MSDRTPTPAQGSGATASQDHQGARRLSSLLVFLLTSVLGGMLTAGLAMPGAAAAVFATQSAIDGMEKLPIELSIEPQMQGSRVYMADGSLLAEFADQHRRYVKLENIAPAMRQAQVAAEDRRFYNHGAIDAQGLLRALIGNLGGKDTQGASTLTQQYVKLVRLGTAEADGDEEEMARATEQTIERKVVEMRYALAVEKQLTKDQILERYLNIAYFGDRAYGVESAAQHYFSTSASKLTLPQAAMLAGLVRNPARTDPIHNPDAALNRRNVVLELMQNAGYLTADQVATAKKDKTINRKKFKAFKSGCANAEFPFICQYVEYTLLTLPSLGKDRDTREKALRRNGYVIKTLIEPKVQRAAERAIARRVDPRDPAIATSVQIQPKTGLIISMAQSRPKMGKDNAKGQTFWNYAVATRDDDGNPMGGAEGYHGGSTFKAFTAAAALAMGRTPAQTYNVGNGIQESRAVWKSCDGPTYVGGPHIAWNSSLKEYGTYNMMGGMSHSVNTYFMAMEQDIGICATVRMAEKLGLKRADGKPFVLSAKEKRKKKRGISYDEIPSFTLGAAEITPLSMTEAYATLANKGVHCDPIILESIKTSNGKKRTVPSANCKQVIDPNVAAGVTATLRAVMTSGTGRSAYIPGWPMAGKTGTVSNAKSVWFAGYTPEIAGSAMVAVDKTHPWWKKVGRSQTLAHLVLPYSRTYVNGYGGSDAVPIWRAAMLAELPKVPRTGFPSYDGPVPYPSGFSPGFRGVQLKAGPDGTVTGVGLAPGQVLRGVSLPKPPPPKKPAAPPATTPATKPPTTKPPTTKPPTTPKAPPTTKPPTKAPSKPGGSPTGGG